MRRRPDWIHAMLSAAAKTAADAVDADAKGRSLLYRITSPSGRVYIGATNELVYRLSMHRYGVGAIGRSLRKYGLREHVVEVLAVGPTEYIFELEHAAVEAWDARVPNGLNLVAGGRRGGGTPGRVVSAAVRAKQSATMKGRPCNATTESREKQAESLRRFWSDPQNRAKMSAARRHRQAA